jgi:hypothetical protein
VASSEFCLDCGINNDVSLARDHSTLTSKNEEASFKEYDKQDDQQIS